MTREHVLKRRIRILTTLFILGLVISGVTAIPLEREVSWLVSLSGADRLGESSAWAMWLTKVHTALIETSSAHPFLFYGTDWLAFGHFVIALAFVGALRNPVRNRWLFDFGLLACGLVIPFALVFGEIRGIPLWWRLVDCSFGVLGFVPLWFCRQWVKELEAA